MDPFLEHAIHHDPIQTRTPSTLMPKINISTSDLLGSIPNGKAILFEESLTALVYCHADDPEQPYLNRTLDKYIRNAATVTEFEGFVIPCIITFTKKGMKIRPQIPLDNGSAFYTYNV